MVHFVGFNDAGFRILDGPYQTCQNSRCHLHACGILIGGQFPCHFNGKLGTKPIGVLFVAIEQHAKFVFAVINFVLGKHMLHPLPIAAIAQQFVPREHRVIGGMISVMTSWPIGNTVSGFHRVVVGDRYGLIVSDEITKMRASRRRPRQHPRIGTRPFQID